MSLNGREAMDFQLKFRIAETVEKQWTFSASLDQLKW